MADVVTKIPSTSSTLKTFVNVSESTHSVDLENVKSWQSFVNNTDMLKRGFYVLIAVGLIVVLYFGIRTYRSRSRSSRSYGLLASRGETIELNPLNSDSEDDYTVYEARKLNF